MQSRPELTERLRAALLSRRNPDGGWGYFAGKQTRLEPTVWAVLALGGSVGRGFSPGDLPALKGRPTWAEDVPGTPINYTFQALRGLAFASTSTGRADVLTIARALLDVRGVTFEPSTVIRQDNSLQAWPWVDQTFSWAEPTSVVVLLLKKLRADLPPAAAGRILDGERVLIDRVCHGGGWNYGGSNAFGQNLPAYVPTTAWALLAMQDRPDHPVVTLSVTRMLDDLRTEASPQALALAAIALRVHGRPPAPVLAVLEKEIDRATTYGNVVSLAMALYALTGQEHKDAAFRL